MESFCSSATQSSKLLPVQSDSKAKPKIIMGVVLLEVISSEKFCFVLFYFFPHSILFLLAYCQ